MALKLFKPYISYRAIFNVVRVLLGTEIAEGKGVRLFEQEFAKKFNVKNVVALNSGTSALELAYKLAGIGEGDEVITPVLTCTATNIPLLHLKAKIVFADTDYDLNINIEDVKKKITDKTKAIVFVHFGGNNRGLYDLVAICRERGITLIEDAAQAIGSPYWGFGDFTAISLQAIKTLTSGDGGFLITKRDEDYRRAKRLRWFGYDREEKQKKGDTDLLEPGYKMHMNNVTAAIGRGNLKSLDKVLEKRKKMAELYNCHPKVYCHSWMCIYFGKDALKLPYSQHHYRNDKYTIFKPYKNDCPIMDEIENSWTLLPYHHDIKSKQVIEIMKNLCY